MSGMQKSFLAEASKAETRKAARALADEEAEKALTSTMGRTKTAGQLGHELITQFDADENQLIKLKGELKAKIDALEASLKAAERTRENLAADLDREDDPEERKDIGKDLRKADKAVKDAGRALTLARTDAETDIEKAERKLQYAQGRQAGKTHGEQRITKKALKGINPLIVPVKTAEVGPGQLTFAQMSSVAHLGAYGEENRELIDFDSAITSLNRAIGLNFSEFRSKIKGKEGREVLADPGVMKLISLIQPDEVSSGSLEKNSDLIKICWLYLGGNEVLEMAKGNENFINALTTLEGKNKKPVTKPIAEVKDVEDMFTSEPVKKFSGWLKDFLGKLDAIEGSIIPHVETIIDAPGTLYSGFSTSTAENIADSIYYIFISVFGSPEDKILLLKNTGTFGKTGATRLKGSSANFLSLPARDALALTIKHLTSTVMDFKAFPTEGRKKFWGEKRVNTEYEKGIGASVTAFLGGKFLTEKQPTQIVTDSANVIMGQVFDIVKPLVSATDLLAEIEEATAKLREFTIPSDKLLSGKAKELAEEDITANVPEFQKKFGPDKEGKPRNAVELVRTLFANIETLRGYLSDRELVKSQLKDLLVEFGVDEVINPKTKAVDTEKTVDAVLAAIRSESDELKRYNREASAFFNGSKLEVESELAELRNQLAEQTKQTVVDVRSLILSLDENDTEAVAKIKQAFTNRFETIEAIKNEEIANLEKKLGFLAPEGKTDKLSVTRVNLNRQIGFEKDVLEIVKANIDKFKAHLDSLQAEDIKAICALFTSSAPIQGEKPVVRKKATISTVSPSGKLLVEWIKDMLSALDKYEVQQPGTIGEKDESELTSEAVIKGIRASIHDVNRKLTHFNQAVADATEMERGELEDFNVLLKKKQEELEDHIKEKRSGRQLTVPGKALVNPDGTSNPDEEEALKAAIQDILDAIKEVQDEVDVITKEFEEDFEIGGPKEEHAKLSAALDEAEKTLKEYRDDLAKMGVTSTKSGDARLANILKVSFSSLLYTGKKVKGKKTKKNPNPEETQEVKPSLSIDEFRKLLSTVPTDVFKYLDSKKTNDINDLLDTLHPEADTEGSEQKEAWKKQVRSALHKFFNYLGSSEVKNDENRSQVLSILSAPFTRELESVGDYGILGLETPNTEKKKDAPKKVVDLTTPTSTDGELDEDAILKEKIKAAQKHIDKLEKAGKPAERAKKELKRLKKEQRKVIATNSIKPGSAFSGTPTAVTDEVLQRMLLENAENFQANAKSFYNDILSAVISLNLVEKFSEPTEAKRLLSADDSEFATLVLRLAEKYKSKLSVSTQAAELEDELFLQDLVKQGKISLDTTSSTGKAAGEIGETESAGTNVSHTSTYLTTEQIKKAFLDSAEFATFLAAINAAIKNKTIWYEKKVVNAPIISDDFGLKSATLLNIMSCLKNYDSIEAFDLSANKRNKNVLAVLLNTNNYPADFNLYSSTALLMKIYFLMKLKDTVDAVDVVGQFSEKFLSPEITKPEKTDNVINAVIDQLDTLNDTFEETILQEFFEDFAGGGRLDQEIKENLALLWDLAMSTGCVYSMKNSVLTPVSVTRESLTEVVKREGPACLIQFSSEMGKSDSVVAEFLSLFRAGKQETLNTRLQNCINIIKTGLQFYCGYEATRIIAEHQAYSKTEKNRNIPEVTDKLREYLTNHGVASFIGKFATRINIDPQEAYQSTVKVSATTKDGFANLNNSFLGVFTKDFSWDSIKSGLLAVDVEGAKTKDVVGKSETTKEEKQVETSMKVFLAGLFKKANAYSDTIMLDINSAEAQEAVEKIIAGNEKKTEKLLTGGTPSLTPVNTQVVDTTTKEDKIAIGEIRASKTLSPEEKSDQIARIENSKKVLKLVLKVKKDSGYVNITKGGTSMGTKKTKGKSSKNTKSRVEELASFGQLVTTFSNSLEKVALVLERVYSTDSSLVAMIKDYSASVSQASLVVVQAIDLVTENPYNAEIQTAALDLLKAINVIDPPNRQELTDPATELKEAKESFSKNNLYTNVYSFAEAAALDIDIHNRSMSDIIAAIDLVLSGDPDKFTNAELPVSLYDMADSTTDLGSKLLSDEQIEKYKHAIFTTVMSAETVKDILTGIQMALENRAKLEAEELTKRKKIDPTYEDPEESKEAAVERSVVGAIARNEAIKAGKVAQLERTRNVISLLLTRLQTLKPEMPPTEIEQPLPTGNLGAYLAGSPESLEPHLAKQSADTDEFYAGLPKEKLPTNPLGTTLKPTPKPKTDEPVTEARRDLERGDPKTLSISDIEEAIADNKRFLGRYQDEVKKLDDELAKLNKVLADYREQKVIIGMARVLHELLDNAKYSFAQAKSHVESQNISALRNNIVKLEINPIKTAVPVIISFIKNLRERKSLRALEILADDFTEFYQGKEDDEKSQEASVKAYTGAKKVKVKTKNESIASYALRAFKVLLEEQEGLELPPEMMVDGEDEEDDTRPAIAAPALETSDYILGIARFLHANGHATATAWRATNPTNPSQNRPGVEGSIQSACMIRFLGDDAKGANEWATGNSEAFKNYKACLGSKIMIGFSAIDPRGERTKVTETVTDEATGEQTSVEREVQSRAFVPVQFTKLNIIGKVAAGDDTTINKILYPDEEED